MEQRLTTYQRLRHRIAGIFSRCYNSEDKDYPRYGGRGIGVWRSWHKDRSGFAEYLMSLGGHDNPRLQIDRIANNGNYVPGNLRFTTAKVNSNNRRNSSGKGEGTSTSCPACKTDFVRKDKGQKFCSRACSYEFRRGSDSAGTIGRCEYCEEPYTRKEKGQRFCGYSCSARWRVENGATSTATCS